MSGSNALQITDPNADSDNPLAQAPSWADAYGSVSGAVGTSVDRLGQWLSEQRAKSAKMGLWNDVTGLPTGAGLVNAAQQTGNALLMGTTAPGVRAFHGSPYDFERFDPSRIGTGEGAQAYGHGLYFAEREGTAQTYRDTLATPLFGGQRYNPDNPAHRASYYVYQRNGGDREAALRELDGEDAGLASRTGASSSKYIVEARRRIAENRALIADPSAELPEVTGMGKMYEVNIASDPEHFLHWDKPLSEQSKEIQGLLLPHVESALKNGMMIPNMRDLSSATGAQGYRALQMSQPGWRSGDNFHGEVDASQALHNAGIPGVRYLDQHSRGQGEGTSNYVVFDANTIDILRKYGLAGLMAGGGAAAAGSQQQPQQ
jgi:hypothetical protein